jgi:prepilin-type N-terminal cleavage/methylation domain-containing protein
MFGSKSKATAARGFTLIELLIVVAIIAILAAIAVPNFLEAQVRAKVSRVKADMRSLATAMESYTVDNNKPIPVFNGSFTEAWPPYQTRVENRADRYHWLTSPVAYITSPTKDPFTVSATVSDPISQLLIIWSPPVWLSGLLPGSTGGTNVAYPNYYREQSWGPSVGADGQTLWVAFSFGPDRDADVLDANRAAVGIQDYDPTNGTVSDGDIIRHRD